MQAAAHAQAFNELDIDDFEVVKDVCVIVAAKDCTEPIIHFGKVDKYFILFLKQLKNQLNSE